MTLGQKIRAARIERGMTQRQLVGDMITRNMLSKIENDSATPSIRTLEYLADRLGMPPGHFVGGLAYSNGSSPDGLDDMRAAYRAGDYMECLRLLDATPMCATTDEGYLLRTKASIAAAKVALAEGNAALAKELADSADYYNKEGIYYSVEIDAEMSLILAECSLEFDISEFEYNISEYERAIKEIDFDTRHILAKSEYLCRTGEAELALKALEDLPELPEAYIPKFHYIKGTAVCAAGDPNEAIALLSKAETMVDEEDHRMLNKIYAALEEAYLKIEDYKMAHLYAAKQLGTV